MTKSVDSIFIYISPNGIRIFPHRILQQCRLWHGFKLPIGLAVGKPHCEMILEAPTKTSSNPSPLMSAIAKAGPSAEVI
jgi:hypothetical protein